MPRQIPTKLSNIIYAISNLLSGGVNSYFMRLLSHTKLGVGILMTPGPRRLAYNLYLYSHIRPTYLGKY
jgi:hypothetical protein